MDIIYTMGDRRDENQGKVIAVPSLCNFPLKYKVSGIWQTNTIKLILTNCTKSDKVLAVQKTAQNGCKQNLSTEIKLGISCRT